MGESLVVVWTSGDREAAEHMVNPGDLGAFSQADHRRCGASESAQGDPFKRGTD